MPSAPGFSFIDQYRTLAKELTCDDMMSFDDQEVPQTRFLSDDIKTEVKQEVIDEQQPDIYNIIMMDTFLNSGSDNSSSSNSIHSPANSNFLMGNTDTESLTSMSTVPSFTSSFTSSPSSLSSSSSSSSPSPSSRASLEQMSLTSTSRVSPFLSSSAAPPSTLPFARTSTTETLSINNNSSSIQTTKTSSFVTGMMGSGCTVVSNTDFLCEPSSYTPPSMGLTDDSLEFTDLDKQPMSFYDDAVPFQNSGKGQGQTTGEWPVGIPLEEAVIMMRNVVHGDCDQLNVPYDPLMWTPDHVATWVAWVCRKNNVRDVSSDLYPMNGQTLCKIPPETFHSYGMSGVKISDELELWKAANSCFPSDNGSEYANAQPQHLHNPYMESHQNFNMTPCVSPAPSTCSTSPDSTSSTVSTHSDHSDDENSYNSQPSSKFVNSSSEGNGYNRIPAKMPTGRGHKQTIHLWQFLRELLVSKENHTHCIRWLDRKAGIFKIEESKEVARLWGARKNRPAMNYDKLSRSIRQYYKKGIIKKTEQSKRLVYQFCPQYL